MRVDIVIMSYALDSVWLSYCLKSIRRWTSGFTTVNVVYPDVDDAIMRPRIDEYGGVPIPYAEDRSKGHLSQNLAKCKADLFTGAEYIMHVDSDCIFWKESKPEDFFDNGKPILLRRRWVDAADAICWRYPTIASLGFDPMYETMCRLPIVHHRDAYSLTRSHVSNHVKRSFDDYVLSQKPTFPYGFCEFNTIGGVVLSQMADRYKFVDVPPYPESPVRQLWSHQIWTPSLTDWLTRATEGGTSEPPPPVAGKR